LSDRVIPQAAAISPGQRTGERGAFVGRSRELAELISGVEALLSGRGELLLIAGDAGVGKTRLADEVAASAAARGARVIFGRCWEGGGAPFFWPWIQVARTSLRGLDTAAVDTMLSAAGPGMAHEIRELVGAPKEASAVAETVVESAAAIGSLAAEEKRFRLFDAVANLFKRMAAAQPLALVIDDCHAADIASILFLKFLARDLRHTPILLIATYREAEVRMAPRMAELMSELGREGRLITLRGISQDHVREFVEKSGAETPDTALIAALHRATEGNPFFLTEIVRLMIAEGRFKITPARASAPLAIPEAVQAAIRRRMELVSEPTRNLLSAAAVLGREFELPLLSIVASEPAEKLLEPLEEAITAGMMTEMPGVIGRYRFSHSLISETLYNGLPRIIRLRLHNQIANALKGLHGGDPEPYLAQLAYHYVQALPLGNPAKAVEYAQRAAERAARMVSYEEAADLYRAGLKALDLVTPRDGARRCLMQLRLGEALHLAGQFRESRSIFKDAARGASELGNSEYLARAALGYARLHSTPGIVDRAKVELLEQALAALQSHDDPLRAMLLARLGWELHWSDDRPRLESLSQQAVEAARRLGDTQTLIYVLTYRHLAIWGPSSLDERIAIATELLRLCEHEEGREWAPEAHYMHLTDLLELGEIEAADRAIHQYSEVRQQHWLPFGYGTRARAMRALMRGRFAEAEQLAREALETGQSIRGRAYGAFNDHMYAQRRLEARLVEIEPSVRATLEILPHFTYTRCAMALSLCALSRVDEARGEFDRAANGLESGPRGSTWLQSAALLADVCSHLGEVERARTLYGLLLPYGARNIISDLNGCYGSAHHYLGLLAATAGEFDKAQDHFEASLQFNRKLAAPPFVAWSQYEYARMLLRRDGAGDRDRAQALAGEALTSAKSMGIERFAEKVRELILSAEGGDPAAFGFAAAASSGGRGLPTGRVLATIMFLDIVNSTGHAATLGDREWSQVLTGYYDVVRRELAQYRGREINTFGDDFLALFETPADALRSACAIRTAMRARDLEIRAGLHTGECEISANRISGIALHIGARVVRAAEPGEVMVSGTVKELASGAGLRFDDRGVHSLRGVPGEWRLYAAEITAD
jgi:predicted ATPase/class 3 adenylate cyclase